MAISATLQLSEGGDALAALKSNLIDIYTVLNLDYTVERSCDKTGRPSGGASISVINVTIRAAKQSGTPFHEWIEGDEKLKNGVIKIYDSAGILSSSLQDATGTDTLVDVSEAFDIPNDMMGGAMGEAMDQASDYGSHDDIYDEMSRDDLVEKATEEGITVKSGDTDDTIREKIRIKKETDERYQKMLNASKKLKTDKDIKDFKKDYPEISWPEASDTSKMEQQELEDYIKKNKLEMPKKGATDKETLKIFQEYVALQKDLKGVQDMIDTNDKKKKRRNEIEKVIQEEHNNKELQNKSFNPLYQEAQKRKAQTVSTSKQVVKELTRRVGECARSIEFSDAYCISLKEHFDNNPDSTGKLDSDYPWTIEIGIKPKTVTVKGQQVGNFVGNGTKFTLY